MLYEKHQSIGVEDLAQHLHAARNGARVHRSRADNHGEDPSLSPFLQHVEQLVSAHDRHHEIENEDTARITQDLDEVERFATVTRATGIEALAAK